MRALSLGLVWSFLGLMPLGSSVTRAGETFTAKRIHSLVRLVPLQKITVGPDDQYHGSADPQGKYLVFTKKTDLVSHLMAQDLSSGEVKNLLPLTADSQDAAIGPDGRVAFTYYKFNARGDICYREPLEKAGASADRAPITCIKTDEGQRSSPFWKDTNQLGYLVQDVQSLQTRIVVQDLVKGTRQVLAEGRVFSPSMRPGGRYLFYNELMASNGRLPHANAKSAPGKIEAYWRVLMMKDLATGTSRVVHFALPGISGFPSVSDDEKTLFFSHYLNDTNHDNVIDGDDNSVVFRVPIDDILNHDMVFPEQLTSAENNCSFPRAHGDDLYMTCAFEGYLDVYRAPTSGVVPTDWNEQLLWGAHQTARSYEERILLLDTLKYRLPHQSSDRHREIDERLLSDDLLADDTTASKYYLWSLRSSAAPDRQAFYELLRLYLDALDEKKTQPNPEEITETFRDDMRGIGREMAQVKGQARFKSILQGLLASFVGDVPGSVKGLKQARFNTTAHPLERYFYFELASWALPKISGGRSAGLAERNSTVAGAPRALAEVYRQMMSAPELTEENQIYYAFQFLKEVKDWEPDRDQRIAYLTSFNKGLPAPVTSLLESEVATLNVIAAAGDGAKRKAYRDLDRLMSATRSDYYLRKALYVRSILNFAESAEFLYLGFVASNWMRYTGMQDTEFAYARDVFVGANLDQAYGAFGNSQWQLASDYFYGAVSLTDDLESHYGYIVSMIKQHQRRLIDDRYASLKSHGFVDDNLKFVEALLALIDASGETGAIDGGSPKALDFAIEKLSEMTQDRNSPVRYGLMGYCYLKKLLTQANGYDFDPALFESAHRNLMLAYDIGRGNDRIKASALLNLALLHQRVQNHGLAVQFFSKRKALGFLGPEEAAGFAWFYARSLYYTHQPDKAAVEISEVLEAGTAVPAGFVVPLTERRAFYWVSASRFAQAAESYRQLLGAHQISGDLNLAKTNLSYGYALFRLQQEVAASQALHQSLAYAGRLAVIPKGEARLVDFEPRRLELDAYGLLGRFGPDSERIDALEKRGALLDEAKGMFDDQVALQLQNHLRLAELYERQSPTRAASEMHAVLDLVAQWQSAGQALSHGAYQAVVDCLVHGILHPNLYRREDGERARKLVDKTLAAYRAQKGSQPVLDHQKLKLQMLWAAYSAKVLKEGKPDREHLQRMVASSPEVSPDLESLANALERLD